MKNILYLDTASDVLQMGVSRDGKMRVQARIQCESHRYHSAVLIPELQAKLASAGVGAAELNAMAVHVGPGSFTGLRTGIVTVRVMAQFLQLPVHCFNAFELLAFGRIEPTAVYLDALRGRAYHAVLRYGAEGPVYETAPHLVVSDENGLPKPLSGQSLLISPSLQEAFGNKRVECFPADFSTPEVMLAFLQKYGDLNRRHWRDVHPLYLQEPSITLKKKA